jgi:hypothetical protein
MKHPLRNDFHAVATAAGVTVTFKPTNSIYSFYRLSGSEDVARLGPVSSGTSGDTGDYPPDEVQATAQRVASEVATSVWSVQNEEVADRLTTIRPTSGDKGD